MIRKNKFMKNLLKNKLGKKLKKVIIKYKKKSRRKKKKKKQNNMRKINFKKEMRLNKLMIKIKKKK